MSEPTLESIEADWKFPVGSMLSLLETAHLHAAMYEPTPEFPGVDMDAIYKREPTIEGNA